MAFADEIVEQLVEAYNERITLRVQVDRLFRANNEALEKNRRLMADMELLITASAKAFDGWKKGDDVVTPMQELKALVKKLCA